MATRKNTPAKELSDEEWEAWRATRPFSGSHLIRHVGDDETICGLPSEKWAHGLARDARENIASHNANVCPKCLERWDAEADDRLPKIPDPEQLALAELHNICAHVIRSAPDLADVGELRELQARLEAVDAYVASRTSTGRKDLAKAMRHIEIRVGQLLGEAKPKAGPGRGKKTVADRDGLSRQDRSQLRSMAANPDVVAAVVEASTDEKPATRNKVLEAIKNKAADAAPPAPAPGDEWWRRRGAAVSMEGRTFDFAGLRWGVVGNRKDDPHVPHAVEFIVQAIANEQAATAATMREPDVDHTVEPWPGYRRQGVKRIILWLAGKSLDELAHVANFEAANSNRREVIDAVPPLDDRLHGTRPTAVRRQRRHRARRPLHTDNRVEGPRRARARPPRRLSRVWLVRTCPLRRERRRR